MSIFLYVVDSFFRSFYICRSFVLSVVLSLCRLGYRDMNKRLVFTAWLPLRPTQVRFSVSGFGSGLRSARTSLPPRPTHPPPTPKVAEQKRSTKPVHSRSHACLSMLCDVARYPGLVLSGTVNPQSLPVDTSTAAFLEPTAQGVGIKDEGFGPEGGYLIGFRKASEFIWGLVS